MNVAGVIGHSFGGKAALAYRAPRARGPASRPGCSTRRRRRGPAQLAEAGTAAPETPGDGAGDVLLALESLPGQFSSRDEFMAAMTDRGFSRPLAEWLAMNLDRTDGGVRMRLDLAAVRALLTDYHAQDLWPAVESDLPGRLRFVVAGRSSAVSEDDRRRLESLGDRISLHVRRRRPLAPHGGGRCAAAAVQR